MDNGKNTKTNVRGAIILAFVSIIWGVAFVAQNEGAALVEPFTFNGVRMLIGGLVLACIIPFLDKMKVTEKPKTKAEWKYLLLVGCSCGIALFAASTCQQAGLKYTTAGKGGFITALYIILVPIISVLMKKKIPPHIWVGVAIAVVGMYLLCIRGESGINKGDAIIFCCAILFSFHIMLLDRFTPNVDCVRLSCIQFIVVGIMGIACALVFEHPSFEAMWQAKISILYTALGSTAIAYTFQAIAQKGMNPTLASLAMSLESVFSVVAQVVIQKQMMAPAALLGCALLFSATILSTIPWSVFEKLFHIKVKNEA